MDREIIILGVMIVVLTAWTFVFMVQEVADEINYLKKARKNKNGRCKQF